MEKQKTKIEYDEMLSSCTICNSGNIKFYLKDYKGIQIFICNSCRTQFMNPQYSDRYLSDFYAQYQIKDFKHHRYGDDKTPRFAKHDDNLRLIENFVRPGKFLSVGSGNGIDMEVASGRGWAVEGYEVDEEFTKILSESLKLPMHTGNFVTLDLKNKTYDCVYLNHVIEHPKNPGQYLEKITALLKNGGILYLATPNIHSFSIRLKKLLDFFGLRKKKASYYDTWQHLTYYNPRYFSRVLEKKFGFEVLHLSNDVKSITNGKVQNTVLDKWLFKSGFRLVARKG
ncbi:MAG: class I SAM-dependent methyltransferase [Bacteroidota bacterium]